MQPLDMVDLNQRQLFDSKQILAFGENGRPINLR